MIIMRLVCGFTQVPLLSALTTQAILCLCFRRKATMSNENYISFQYSIKDFPYYKFLDWVMIIKRSLH